MAEAEEVQEDSNNRRVAVRRRQTSGVVAFTFCRVQCRVLPGSCRLFCRVKTLVVATLCRVAGFFAVWGCDPVFGVICFCDVASL